VSTKKTPKIPIGAECQQFLNFFLEKLNYFNFILALFEFNFGKNELFQFLFSGFEVSFLGEPSYSSFHLMIIMVLLSTASVNSS